MNDTILEMINAGELERARAELMHPVRAITAERLAELDPRTRWTLLEGVDAAERRAVFLAMDDEEQAILLENMPQSEARELVQRLPAYTLARALNLASKSLSSDLLNAFPAPKRDKVHALWRQDEDTVARVMRRPLFWVTPEETVGEVTARLREDRRMPEDVGAALLITDREHHYRGLVRLGRVFRAEPEQPVGELLEMEDFYTTPDGDKVEAARLLQRTDLPWLPVLDADGVLVGVLRIDDAMDVLEEDTSEDFYKKAGIGDLLHHKDVVRSEKLTSGGIGYAVKVRMAFLMVTLAGGLAVGGVIDFFEDTLAAVVALAIFIPLVMDMGGNVGTQSTTIFARGLALGHINLNRFFRNHLLREGGVGLAMGLIMAVLAGIIAHFWQGVPNDIPELGFVVGTALFFSVFTASLLGFLLPWVLLKIGVDHAPGADPFITTIKDFTGLAVYFGMAAWLLSAHVPV
ncbi:magnesium transporter [Thioalkalivibrio sp. ALE11]|uniref:magnesium transporter n=1 Tax=Thioalkalivibrio sp. ALE11 TaxID=1265494 RepID=UPI000367EA52|nr:magnesium transporter [Thioalkalivibrio sp. ALE11]